MKILIISEQNNNQLSPSTLSAVSAARQLGSDITLLITGKEISSVISQAQKIEHVSLILWCKSEIQACPSEIDISIFIAGLQKKYQFTHIIAAATFYSKDFMPRVAALLDVAQFSDIVEIIKPDTFIRAVYSGSILATMKSVDPVKVMTVCATNFPEQGEGNHSAPVEIVSGLVITSSGGDIKKSLKKSEEPELSTAKIVIGVGKGIGTEDNLTAIVELAKNLGAAIGASRSAIESGYLPNNLQIGQTGINIAPDLYLAIGISGAVQHIMGIRNAKTIIAVNSDEKAPIFQYADYGLVADVNDLLPFLKNRLGTKK